MPTPLPFGRRAFLRASVMSSAMLALSRLRLAPTALAAEANATPGVPVLSPSDAQILTAVAARMTDTGDPAMPRFADTAALPTIDAALRQLPPDVPQQLSWALWLIEYGPPVLIGSFSTFSALAPEWQDAYLAGWETSRFQIRRTTFQALKNLSFLGYYAQDATWKPIGYQGPWAPMPRLVIGDDGWLARTPRGDGAGSGSAGQ